MRYRFVLLLLVGLAPPATAAVLAATPIDRLALPWWRARFAAKQTELAGPCDLAYYGDSITQDFELTPLQNNYIAVWQHFYGDRHALNLGFKGDTTASLLWRIEHGEAAGISPKLAIVLIGANNLGRLHWSASDTVTGIEADVAAIRQHLPHTRILLLGILPSQRSAWVDATTVTINAALAQHYGTSITGAVVVRTVGQVLMRNGAIDRSLFLDPLLTPPEPPLHPSAEGQRRIAAAIEPTVAAMMGDHRHPDEIR